MSVIPGTPGPMSGIDPAAFAAAKGGQQRLNAQGAVDMGVPVRAVNRSDRPIVWTYDRQDYLLTPGVPTYVPYMAMVYHQGDPRAVDMPGGKLHEQHRRQEREHLRSLYGVYENDEKWAAIPLVECYPIDSDIRFETVLLDPDGISVSEVAATANETEFLRTQLASMQQQVAILAAQVQANDSTAAALSAANLTAADLPSQATTSKSVAPEHSMVPPSPERRVAASKRPLTKGGAPVTKDA